MRRVFHMIKLIPIRFVWFLDKKRKLILALKRIEVYNKIVNKKIQLEKEYLLTYRVNPTAPYTKLKKVELDVVKEILSYYGR